MIFSNLVFLEGDNFINDVRVLGHIGAGNSAVFEVQDIESNEIFAMKEIVIRDDYQSKLVEREIDLLKRLGDQFLIKMHKHMLCKQIPIDEFQSQIMVSFILMEKGQTSLSRFVEIQTEYLPTTTIKRVILQLVEGFASLQRQSIAHQDIKPENILVIDEELNLKVCDLGSGLEIENENQTHTITGTLPFLAPEIFDNLPQHKTNVNIFKSDVFSLGLCILYLITFKKFSSRERRQITPQVYKEIIKDWQKLADLITSKDMLVMRALQSCLSIDPNERSDFIELNLILKQMDADERFDQQQRSVEQSQVRLLEMKTTAPDQIKHAKTGELPSETKLPSFSKSMKRQVSASKLSKTTSFKKPTRMDSSVKKESFNFPQLVKVQASSVNEDMAQSQIRKVQSNPHQIDFITSAALIDGPTCALKLSYSAEKVSLPPSNLINLVLWIETSQINFEPINDILTTYKYLRNFSFKLYQGTQVIVKKTTGISNVNSLTLEINENSHLQIFNVLIQMNSESLQSLKLIYAQTSLNLETLEQPIKSLLTCKQLSNLSLQIQGITDCQEQVHKTLFGSLQKLKLQSFELHLPDNNLTLTQPQWYIPKVQYLTLNYGNNKIGQCMNSLSMALASLQLLQLDLNISNNNVSPKDIYFLIVQILKIQTLVDLSLNLDYVADSQITNQISQIFKLPSLTCFSISAKGNPLNFDIIKLFDRLYQKNPKAQKHFFSARFDRSLSTIEIINYMVNNKLLSQFKIDFLTEDVQSIQLVLLKDQIQTQQTQLTEQLNLCNGGENICTSKMWSCLTCTNNYSIFGRPINICEMCRINCHFHRIVSKNRTVQHNTIHSLANVCDCSSLGICKNVAIQKCVGQSQTVQACYIQPDGKIACQYCKTKQGFKGKKYYLKFQCNYDQQ